VVPHRLEIPLNPVDPEREYLWSNFPIADITPSTKPVILESTGLNPIT